MFSAAGGGCGRSCELNGRRNVLKAEGEIVFDCLKLAPPVPNVNERVWPAAAEVSRGYAIAIVLQRSRGG